MPPALGPSILPELACILPEFTAWKISKQKLKYVNYHFPLRHPVTLIQGDQLNIAVYFWYLVKSDLSSVYVYRSVH